MPPSYVVVFCGLGVTTIALLGVYDLLPIKPLKITRRLKLIMPDRPRPPEKTTDPDEVMAKMELYFDKKNIRNMQLNLIRPHFLHRKITKRYFDPKKDVIYFSDLKVFRQKCDQSTFTLRKSHKKTCDVVHTPIKHYRTCAVVGNSGILLHSSCGAEIDAHEFVIRSNLPPVSPYRTDVGSRTDLTIVNGKRLRQISDALQSDNSVDRKHTLAALGETRGMILAYSIELSMSDKIRQMQVVENAIKKNSMSTITAFPSKSFKDKRGLYVELLGRASRGTFASTGLNSFALASTFCDRISMYGFYPMERYKNKPVPYHYYDKHGHSASHELYEENELLKRLDEQRSIRLVVGKCKDVSSIHSALEGAWANLQKLGKLVM
ncbi:PREDICTED: alpha-2,8-sialyltransferase 8B-like [Branchiostoma belcheri]|uniref:Alpha-2,8-sialyltransferase 8B-like n=1 Tax=Branchiostoma belcheri TaxID=7741 RepID=A0A6P4YHI0_BRABE|nr:PREDICTED: alpha-2,8-sialyltransferase 8B-like [Branchiostoma belcheri]